MENYDGKRMRKPVVRKTVDYYSPVITYMKVGVHFLAPALSLFNIIIIV